MLLEPSAGAMLKSANPLRRASALPWISVGCLGVPASTEEDADAVFAAAFFTQLNAGRDPLEAAELAIRVAADSGTRRGPAGVPTQESIYDLLTEV